MNSSKALADAMKAALNEMEKNCRSDSIYGHRAGSPPLAPWPSNPCEILFLDFDGVLNSDESVQALGTKYKFSPVNIAAANEILTEESVFVVVTSTWRDSWSLKEIARLLEMAGLRPGHVIGKTPSLGKDRGLEIDAWLRDVPFIVRAFVIVDDHDDMAMHSNRLVRTDSRIGLTMGNAQSARAMLQLQRTTPEATKNP